LKDVFAVQEEIAKAVAEQLRVTLLGSATNALARPSNVNLDAYNAYLQGKFISPQPQRLRGCERRSRFLKKRSGSIELCRSVPRSVSLPFFRAFFQGVKGKEEYELARQATLKAVALKPGLTEARAQLAYYQVLWIGTLRGGTRIGERLQRRNDRPQHPCTNPPSAGRFARRGSAAEKGDRFRSTVV